MFLSLFFFILAAVCNALMDKIQFHWYKFRWKDKLNPQYWNPALSWKNKYIDNNPQKGLKYKGAFGFLANFLDAWHLFKMIMIISFALSAICFPVAFKFCVFNSYWLNGALWLIVLGVAWNIPFNYCFHKVFNKPKNIN